MLNPKRDERLKNRKLPCHWNRTMVELLPKDGGVCLDLGCCDGTSKELIELFGYKWIGLDIIYNENLTVVGLCTIVSVNLCNLDKKAILPPR